MRQAETLAELARIRSDNFLLLDGHPDVIGTALGYKNFDPWKGGATAPAILVFVRRKISRAWLPDSRLIPATLESADGSLRGQTDVLMNTDQQIYLPPLSEENQNLVHQLTWQHGAPEWISPGMQLGFMASDGPATGTTACSVKKLGRSDVRGFLTNQHIGLAPTSMIYIPSADEHSAQAGITRSAVTYLADDDFSRQLDDPFTFFKVDAAFVEVHPEHAGNLHNQLPESNMFVHTEPTTVNYDSMDLIGTKVKKYGATTGLTHGVIIAAMETNDVLYPEIENISNMRPARTYTDFIIVDREAEHQHDAFFSYPGDSGSLILIDDAGSSNDNKPIGMMWGGGVRSLGMGVGPRDTTSATRIDRIVDYFGVELI